MNIGKLNKQIELVFRLDKPTSTGVYYQTQETHIKTVWANVKPVSASVYYGSQQIADGVTHAFTIRYDDDLNINGDTQIKYNNTLYKVKRYLNINESNRFVLINCEAIETY